MHQYPFNVKSSTGRAWFTYIFTTKHGPGRDWPVSRIHLGHPGWHALKGSPHSCGSSGTKSLRPQPSWRLLLSGHFTLWLQIFTVLSSRAQGSLSWETDTLVLRLLHRRPITAGDTDQRYFQKEPVTPSIYGLCPGPRATYQLAAPGVLGDFGLREGGNDAARSFKGEPSSRRAPKLGRGAGRHRTHLTNPEVSGRGKRAAPWSHHAPLGLRQAPLGPPSACRTVPRWPGAPGEVTSAPARKCQIPVKYWRNRVAGSQSRRHG